MNAIQIPEEAGRAGATAYAALPDLVDSQDDVVRAILEAAAPHLIAAELDAMATRYEGIARDVAAWAEGRDDHDRLPGEGEAGAYASEAEALRQRANELRTAGVKL